MVSHAGIGLLREVGDLSGLTGQVSAVLADTYKGPWVHDPGWVFTDLAAAVADGADCVSGIGSSGGPQSLHLTPVASLTTTWRLLDQRIDTRHLARMRRARAAARARVWAAGAAPTAGQTLTLDVDARCPWTIPIARNRQRRPGSGRLGFIRCWCSPTAPTSPVGRRWPASCGPECRVGTPPLITSRSWTEALAAASPETYRPRPGEPGSPSVSIRADSAGATHGFAAFCPRGRGRVLGSVPGRPVRDEADAVDRSRRGHRRSIPMAASGTGRGSPRPPPCWTSPIGPRGAG